MAASSAGTTGSWYQGSALDDTQFGVSAVPKPGVGFPEIEDAIEKVIADVVTNGVRAEDLERVKTQLISEAIYARHGENLSGVAWHPEGKWLASAGADGTVRLWDVETGAAGKVFRLHSPSGHLGRLTFSPEGRHLLVNSGKGTVYVLRLSTPN